MPEQATVRDPRSLFDIDERLVELMDQVADAAADGQEPSSELVEEINEYIEAFHSKVDRIAGYLRWQESIASICGAEAERLSARKKSAEGRVSRLKNMLLHFMLSRGLKKLEGDHAAIGLQPNSAASLVVDDPLKIGECFFERSIGFTKPEIQELIYQLPVGELRGRLETQLAEEGWQVNGSAIRAAIVNGSEVDGARLVKGHHIRIR
ncbi:MAG: siphovirus Gp157 family protein [Bryobacteraceae bacterium]|nr:siphovirus Gp157 family protein [Solibacteraceae bacterium]MCO5349986.1 siphovirus Gp157 family protein [Bryobacteraceae bacterium]